MTNPKDPAFPVAIEAKSYSNGNIWVPPPGLTKREYFAAQALRGAIEWQALNSKPQNFDVKLLAKDCVGVADALIEALKK